MCSRRYCSVTSKDFSDVGLIVCGRRAQEVMPFYNHSYPLRQVSCHGGQKQQMRTEHAVGITTTERKALT